MKKNEGKGAIAVILIIVLLLIIAGLCYVIYDLYNNKLDSETQITDLNGQVEKLNGKIEVYEEKLDQITKTISKNTEKENKDDEEKIVLEGTYAIPNSDTFYEFYKNGEAKEWGNTNEMYGTYEIEENVIKIKWNKNIIMDIDSVGNKEEKINKEQEMKIIDNNTLEYKDESGSTEKIVKQ